MTKIHHEAQGGRFESYLGSQISISATIVGFSFCLVLFRWFERLGFSKGCSNSVCNWPCRHVADFRVNLRKPCFSCTG